MRLVVAGQDERRGGAVPHEIAADAKDEIAAPHTLTESTQYRRIELRPCRALLLRPFRKALGEVGRKFRVEADGVLEHRSADSFRHHLAQGETKARSDAAAEDMAALDAEMIHERELVGRVSVPAMIGGNGAARAAGIALIHRDDAVPRREQLGPVAPS